MNPEELEALRLAREAFNTPQTMTPEQAGNVQTNDLVRYANQLPEPPTPRELLEQRMPMESKTLMDVEGLALPSKASDIRVDELGSYPVDAQGNRLEWMRVSPMLPVATNSDETRLAMPYLLQQAGNIMGGIAAPVRGAGMVVGAGPVRRAAEVAPRTLTDQGLYSAASDVLAGLKQEKMSGQDMVNYLKSKAPKDELQQTGFEQWAASRPQVTRQEAMDYLKAQQPEIKEIVFKREQGDLLNAERRMDELEEFRQTRGLSGAEESEFDRLAEFVNRGLSDAPAPKYEQYQLPGGENYREILLQDPGNVTQINQIKQKYEPQIAPLIAEREALRPEYMRLYKEGPDNEFYAIKDKFNDLNQQVGQLQGRMQTEIGDIPQFKSSHWDEPNVLAHLRMSDRNIGDKKVLHIEEIQSDWAQQGRQQGFRNPNAVTAEEKAEADKLYKSYSRNELDPGSPELARLEELESKIRSAKMGLPQGPYVTDTAKWTQFALKRALREAAQGGYDEMIITPGSEQLKRWGNEGLVNYYDNVVPSQLKKLVREIDPKADVGKFQLKPTETQLQIKQLDEKMPPLYAQLQEVEPAINKIREEAARKIYDQTSRGGSSFDFWRSRPYNEETVQQALDLSPEYAELAARNQKIRQEIAKIELQRGELVRKRSSNKTPFDGFIKFELTPEIREKILTQGFKTFKDGGAVDDSKKKSDLLIDKFPTHYLPDVGRQVMAEGGMIERALHLAEKFGSSPRDTVQSIKRQRGRP